MLTKQCANNKIFYIYAGCTVGLQHKFSLSSIGNDWRTMECRHKRQTL